MVEAVNEILAEGFAMEIFSVGVDVIVGQFVDALVALGTIIYTRLQRVDGSILRTENDVVNFALARCEFAVGGQRARDGGRGAGLLRADVEAHHVALFYLSGELFVAQRGT